ncbi:hypothetical protein QT381_14790 [Galbitalea sp. SE-J8]|nr:hypothetical protein [Galbitalea sp. SE-J8]MDM4764272.1 hypothetical protein [Galbitalea sp. SE-J8]
MTKILFTGTFGKIGVRNLRWRNYASVTAKTEAHFSALAAPRSRS